MRLEPTSGAGTTVGRAHVLKDVQSIRAIFISLVAANSGLNKPALSKASYDEYVSDPAKPVPYRQRPTLAQYGPDSTWGEWLVDDQRHAACRPDVLVYETEPSERALRVAGGRSRAVCVHHRK